MTDTAISANATFVQTPMCCQSPQESRGAQLPLLLNANNAAKSMARIGASSCYHDLGTNNAATPVASIGTPSRYYYLGTNDAVTPVASIFTPRLPP